MRGLVYGLTTGYWKKQVKRRLYATALLAAGDGAIIDLTLGLMFILLNTLDLLITMVGLGHGMRELNPLVHILGWGIMIPMKFLIALTGPILAIWANAKCEAPVGTYMMKISSLLLLVVCIWNTIQILI
jgi:hypothetical protein